ncbi:RagB/SusD family nutrient uptake outer membrane protein [Viscerimonas tarda]
MRNRLKKTLLLPSMIMILGLSSCDDFLTILPQSDIVLENYWEDKSDVESVVATCYRAMLEDDFMKKVLIWGELRSDNLIAGKSLGKDELDILDANLLPTNSFSKWNNFYTVINYCNTVLLYAPSVQEKDPNFKPAELGAIKAEVLTLRALCYFYLIRAFHEAPLTLEAAQSDEQNYKIPKSPESVIINRIIEDLLEAEKSALKTYNKTVYDKGRVTKDVVRALLADVYLWNQDYQQCIDYCDAVIESKRLEAEESNFWEEGKEGKYPLLEAENIYSSSYAYTQIFGNGNSIESIFELQFTQTTKTNSMIDGYYGNQDNPIGKLSAPLFATETGSLYPKTDNRVKDFTNTNPTITATGVYPIAKYAVTARSTNAANNSSYNYRNTTANWILYRLTDVMLMKAEALVQVGQSEDNLKGAFELVSAVHNRSNPTIGNDTLVYSSYNTVRDMEDLVLLERQRELIFEGKRWFDLLRLARREGNNTRLLDKVVSKYTENQNAIRSKISSLDALYFPINQDELKINPALKQNPAYLTGSSSN